MKAGQFSDEQIAVVLQEAARGEKTVGTFCQEKGISERAVAQFVRRQAGNADRIAVRARQPVKPLRRDAPPERTRRPVNVTK